jgi:hypothetical protein
MASIDWGAVWEFMWPILREGIIAFLIALLALLGYDQVIPSRYMRSGVESTADKRRRSKKA